MRLIAATGAADRLRATTDAAQQALETGAGVSIEEARANFVPALSSAAQATLTLNATMQALDTSFRETIAEIQRRRDLSIGKRQTQRFRKRFQTQLHSRHC